MVGDRPLLDARGLTKAFGGARALNEVDLTVLPGEVHGLLGENGSGKSTLIKILAGYHTPDAGELFVNGREVPLPLGPGEPQRARHGVRAPGPRPGGVADGRRELLHGRHREAVEPLLRVLVRGAPRRPARSSPATASRSTRTPPSTGSARWSGRCVAIVRALEGLRRGSGDEPTPAGARRAHRLPPGARGGAAVRPRPPDRRARVERAVRVARPGRGAADHRPRDRAARRPGGGHRGHRADLAPGAGEPDPRPGAAGDGHRRTAAARRPVRGAAGARPQHPLAARRVLRPAHGRGARAHRAGRLGLRGLRLRDLRRHPGRERHAGGGRRAARRRRR